jgi:hypothetical protein
LHRLPPIILSLKWRSPRASSCVTVPVTAGLWVRHIFNSSGSELLVCGGIVGDGHWILRPHIGGIPLPGRRIERKEVFLAYRFALQYYRSRVSSRSELLSTLVTKFGDPRGAATSFPIGPSCIPYSAPRGDLAAPMLLWVWA